MLQAVVLGATAIVCLGVIYSVFVNRRRPHEEQPRGPSNDSWLGGRQEQGEVRRRLNRGHSDVGSEIDCVICLEAPPQVQLYPCNHVILCEACIIKLISKGNARCPVCRVPFKGYSNL